MVGAAQLAKPRDEKNYFYLEDVDSSKNNIFRRSSGSRGDAASIGLNASGEWSWKTLINISYSSLFPIINTFIAYIEMNHFCYTR